MKNVREPEVLGRMTTIYSVERLDFGMQKRGIFGKYPESLLVADLRQIRFRGSSKKFDYANHPTYKTYKTRPITAFYFIGSKKCFREK